MIHVVGQHACVVCFDSVSQLLFRWKAAAASVSHMSLSSNNNLVAKYCLCFCIFWLCDLDFWPWLVRDGDGLSMCRLWWLYFQQFCFCHADKQTDTASRYTHMAISFRSQTSTSRNSNRYECTAVLKLQERTTYHARHWSHICLFCAESQLVEPIPITEE